MNVTWMTGRKGSSRFEIDSFTWGESNGYWSENLKSNWKFSPVYKVSGAPSMSMRILWSNHRMKWSEKVIMLSFTFAYPNHRRPFDYDEKWKETASRMEITHMPGVGCSVSDFSSLVRRFRTRSHWNDRIQRTRRGNAEHRDEYAPPWRVLGIIASFFGPLNSLTARERSSERIEKLWLAWPFLLFSRSVNRQRRKSQSSGKENRWLFE